MIERHGLFLEVYTDRASHYFEAANRFLREVYLSEHNARFAVAAEDAASAFVEVPEALWRDGLCTQEERRGRTARGDGGAWVDHQ